ncbi:MAG: copper ion binding protein [Actinobacteria bacterium]|nr:copper ion binding protein [Actinomycetota bacterium]
MTDLTLNVPEIHCDHCKMSIEGAVGALDGVASARVDVAATTVAVEFDAPATAEAIVAAIEGQGYEVPPQG